MPDALAPPGHYGRKKAKRTNCCRRGKVDFGRTHRHLLPSADAPAKSRTLRPASPATLAGAQRPGSVPWRGQGLNMANVDYIASAATTSAARLHATFTRGVPELTRWTTIAGRQPAKRMSACTVTPPAAFSNTASTAERGQPGQHAPLAACCAERATTSAVPRRTPPGTIRRGGVRYEIRLSRRSARRSP